MYTRIYLPEAAKQMIPKHNVLSIIALWDAMVNVVNLGIVQCHAKEGDDTVVPSMVKSSKDCTNDEKDDGRGSMQFHAQRPTIQKARKDMIILAKEEFHGMDIDGVDGGSARKVQNVKRKKNEAHSRCKEN